MNIKTPISSPQEAEIPRERIMELIEVFYKFASGVPKNSYQKNKVHIGEYDFLRGSDPRDAHFNIVKNPKNEEFPRNYGKDGNVYVQVDNGDNSPAGAKIFVSFNETSVLGFQDNSKLRAELKKVGASKEAFEIAGKDYFRCADEAVLAKLASFAEMLKPALRQQEHDRSAAVTQVVVDNRKNVDDLLGF